MSLLKKADGRFNIAEIESSGGSQLQIINMKGED